MASDAKKSIFKLTKIAAIAFSAGMGLAVMPAVADVGTWFKVAHDAENLRAQAFTATLDPYTGWIPQFMGLDHEKPGLLTPLMDIFIGPELRKLEAKKRETQRVDEQRMRESFNNKSDTAAPDSPTILNEDPLANDPLGSDPLGADPLGDQPFLSSGNLLNEDPLTDSFLSASLDENYTSSASDFILDSVLALV